MFTRDAAQLIRSFNDIDPFMMGGKRPAHNTVLVSTTIIVVMAVLCSTLALASTDTTATDSLRSRTTERIVVSASRWEERASTSSRQIISLTPKDIRNLNPGTSADLLEASGEVYMQRSQAGGGSPRLRGFAANNVLMVMDGIRINNAIYRTGNLRT
jgi:hemoglobin/transferrin/lactoferrin receptor protein